MLALDGDCGCHWLVVAHGSDDGVMMMAVMVVVTLMHDTKLIALLPNNIDLVFTHSLIL